MADLLLRPQTLDAEHRIHNVTPESAGWSHVGFEVCSLEPEMELRRETGGREYCIVLLSGRATVLAGEGRYAGIGERMSVFEEVMPTSVYVPAQNRFTVAAETPVEVALCSAPAEGTLPPRLITPDAVRRSSRGKGTNLRHVRDILPETEAAESLLVVEVVTPGGNWSSYPPHKHDTDDLPNESRLEETYYHKLNPAQGFAFQRVYTDDRALDETMCVHDGDVVLVPRGYHPCGAAHGYDLWYLNVMAGPQRAWKFRTEPAHRWLLEG